MAVHSTRAHQATLFGHPTGLFTLFFAEMWERFSYYGMRALLVFYMLKGFLKYQDAEAYAVYGAYTALVYATPFIGGMLADRVLGARRAVLLGGLLMAAGHLLMTVEQSGAFFTALALLICGNGFFKPNISTIVGSLYPEGSHKRDGGFTLFYMGINLGAAMAPLLCGYVGETYGWHYGFGLATVGMLTGIAVFWAPVRLTQGLILGGALLTAGGMIWLQEDPYLLAINGLVALALLVSAGVAFVALNRGGLPDDAGLPPDPEAPRRLVFGVLRADWAIYLGVAAAVPVIALLVQRNAVAGVLLVVLGAIALSVLLFEALKPSTTRVERQRMYVVLILMFFSMLFWAFFEQAGSSINNFTDRNVDRVVEDRTVAAAEVGTTIALTPSQEQLGHVYQGEALNLTRLEAMRAGSGGPVEWPVAQADVGMGVGGSEIPASVFQAVNPVFILVFGLVFTWLWGFLGKRSIEPNIPVKFGLGLLQLGLGFGALWYGAGQADAFGMVALGWLLLGYLLHTTGELCLSPVGLSMVTRLSPARIVSTVMGAWFLATAFSSYLAGLIAQLTGVGHGEGEEAVIPIPQETVDVYGTVFGQIAVAAIVSALIVFALSPLLHKWMHEEAERHDDEEGAGTPRKPPVKVRSH
ncbi:peptide MFS transporter [Myxococcota bacterium]|nr:peptide MFS transporter [Myxococcota bacterium]